MTFPEITINPICFCHRDTEKNGRVSSPTWMSVLITAPPFGSLYCRQHKFDCSTWIILRMEKSNSRTTDICWCNRPQEFIWMKEQDHKMGETLSLKNYTFSDFPFFSRKKGLKNRMEKYTKFKPNFYFPFLPIFSHVFFSLKLSNIQRSGGLRILFVSFTIYIYIYIYKPHTQLYCQLFFKLGNPN